MTPTCSLPAGEFIPAQTFTECGFSPSGDIRATWDSSRKMRTSPLLPTLPKGELVPEESWEDASGEPHVGEKWGAPEPHTKLGQLLLWDVGHVSALVHSAAKWN